MNKTEKVKEKEASDEQTSKSYDSWVMFAKRNADRIAKGRWEEIIFQEVFKDILRRYRDESPMEWSKELIPPPAHVND